MNVTVKERSYDSLDAMRGRLREIDDMSAGQRLPKDAQDEWNGLVEAIEEFKTRSEYLHGSCKLTVSGAEITVPDNQDWFSRRLLECAGHVSRGTRELLSWGDFIETYTGTAGDEWESYPMRSLTTSNVTTSQQHAGPTLFDLLRPSSIALSSGIPVYRVTGESESVPILTGSGTVAWYSEAGTITSSDAVFGSTVVTPRKLAGITRLSNEVIEDAVPSVLEAVRGDLLGRTAAELDRVTFLGTGTAPEPRGFDNITGVTNQNVGAITTSLNFASSAVEALGTANASPPYAFAAAPSVWGKIQRLRDTAGTAGQYLIPFNSDDLPTLWGARGFRSTQLGAGTAYWYSPQSIRFVERIPTEIEVDRSRYFDSDETAVRIRTRADLFAIHPNAIVRGTAIS